LLITFGTKEDVVVVDSDDVVFVVVIIGGDSYRATTEILLLELEDLILECSTSSALFVGRLL
jgi:hypothetical protein